MRITCPECGAGLKSKTGFLPGKTINCPKCETSFDVEESAEEDVPQGGKRAPVRAVAAADDEGDYPKKKKKKKRRDDEDGDGWSYRSSWIRYAVLGVLVVVMLVLGYFLIQKQRRDRQQERENAANSAKAQEADEAPPLRARETDRPQVKAPVQRLNPGGGGPVGQFGLPLTTEPLTGDQQRMTELKAKLKGQWEGVAPDGATHQVRYGDDGRFDHSVNFKDGRSQKAAGSWAATAVIGTKGLKLSRGSPTPVRVIFEDDELIHDTSTVGESVVLRRK